MHDNDFKTSCHHMSTCALTGASAFFDAIPGSFMLINGPLWCYFYAMKYVEDYDASALRRFHCTQPEGNALVYGTEKDLLAGLDFVKATVWLATTLPALRPKPNFPAPFTLRTAAASPVILRKDMRLRCFG